MLHGMHALGVKWARSTRRYWNKAGLDSLQDPVLFLIPLTPNQTTRWSGILSIIRHLISSETA